MHPKEHARREARAGELQYKFDRLGLTLAVVTAAYCLVGAQFGGVSQHGEVSTGFLVGVLVAVALLIATLAASAVAGCLGEYHGTRLARHHERLR